MPIITLVSNKGGAGKTTLSMNLAAGLQRRAATCLLDADPQGSSTDWARIGEGPGIGDVRSAHQDLEASLREAARQFDHVVVDCPPSILAPQTELALRRAQIALIPVQPSPVDIWATVHIGQALAQARDSNPGLQAFVLVNQLESRTMLSRLIDSALEEVGIPALHLGVHRRAIFRNCLLDGRTVYDMGARGSAAVAELEAIIDEVLPA